MTFLHELPADDPLRNTPMKHLHAEIRNKKSKAWRALSTFRIGANTYNQCSAWHEHNEVRIP